MMIPEFWMLVIGARYSGQAVDDFNLKSTDEASVKKFAALVQSQQDDAKHLIRFCVTHHEILMKELSR